MQFKLKSNRKIIMVEIVLMVLIFNPINKKDPVLG